MAKGWIKVHRTIWENKIWLGEPFTKGQAWVDLLLLADYEDSSNYKKGCVYKSVLFLSDRWQWSRGKTRRFLSQLESQHMIQQKSQPNGHVITIVKYGFYQDGEPTKKPTKKPINEPTDEPYIRNKEIDYNALPTASEIIYGGYT